MLPVRLLTSHPPNPSSRFSSTALVSKNAQVETLANLWTASHQLSWRVEVKQFITKTVYTMRLKQFHQLRWGMKLLNLVDSAFQVEKLLKMKQYRHFRPFSINSLESMELIHTSKLLPTLERSFTGPSSQDFWSVLFIWFSWDFLVDQWYTWVFWPSF